MIKKCFLVHFLLVGGGGDRTTHDPEHYSLVTGIAPAVTQILRGGGTVTPPSTSVAAYPRARACYCTGARALLPAAHCQSVPGPAMQGYSAWTQGAQCMGLTEFGCGIGREAGVGLNRRRRATVNSGASDHSRQTPHNSTTYILP